jgi:hypothetical protein
VDDKALAAILAELVDREPLFHRTELGTSRADVEAMTTADFWEVGASGSVYDREVVWATLERRYAAGEPDEWETLDVALRPLTGDVYLLTYLLRQGERLTRRATVWENASGHWRAVYHQGTLVRGSGPGDPAATTS